ncbi:ABC transporter ATP-binding protein [Leifsonia sp. NPDC058230]|uniref:ABC transporter ATP-binding protein n=1 Tax=Leifsonia sp. NPDC058230 TaxID=3346391 RepID=UPI0036D90DDF
MISAHGVGHSYDSDAQVLDAIDFTASAGEVIALTGPSGRGKSTLLFILGMLLRPTRGELRVLGQDVQEIPDRARSRMRSTMFGYLFQDAALDATRSVIDNVTEPGLYANGLGRSALRPTAEALLKEFDVSTRSRARPGRLSGGQAQRIALCRALVLDPKIVIADEPTGNLDQETSNLVINGLRSRARAGSTVIIATHDERIVSASDREVRL